MRFGPHLGQKGFRIVFKLKDHKKRLRIDKMVTSPGLWSTILEYFFLKGTLMKYKFILFSPWLLKRPSLLELLATLLTKSLHPSSIPGN